MLLPKAPGSLESGPKPLVLLKFKDCAISRAMLFGVTCAAIHPKTWCCPGPGPLLRVISRFMVQQQQGSEKTSMAKRATKCHVLSWGLMSQKGPCWCPRAMFQPWLYRNEWHRRLPVGMMEFKVASKGLFYIHSPAAVGVWAKVKFLYCHQRSHRTRGCWHILGTLWCPGPMLSPETYRSERPVLLPGARMLS